MVELQFFNGIVVAWVDRDLSGVNRAVSAFSGDRDVPAGSFTVASGIEVFRGWTRGRLVLVVGAGALWCHGLMVGLGIGMTSICLLWE